MIQMGYRIIAHLDVAVPGGVTVVVVSRECAHLDRGSLEYRSSKGQAIIYILHSNHSAKSSAGKRNEKS